MNHSNRSDISQLIEKLADGDQSVLGTVVPLMYDQLRQLADQRLRNDQLNCSISPTVLVHETYLRLVGQKSFDVRGKAHFLAIAAITMRRILVEFARRRSAEKRGGGQLNVTLDEARHATPLDSDRVLALHEALDNLSEVNPRQATIIVYWFFGGLTHKEIGEVLGISVPTVRKDWRMARAWLASQLDGRPQT